MTQLSAILILLALPFTTSFAQSNQPHPGLRSVAQANFLFKEASESQKNGKSDLAIENYKKILKDYPQFPEKFVVFLELMKLQVSIKNYPDAMKLGKQAILQHPPSGIYNAIQILRAQTQLLLGSPLQTKIIIDELLKSKPDLNSEKSALILKAEAYSQLGKHKEAFASLDAAKGNEKFADTELQIRARACSAIKIKAKEEALDYFHEKNLCFKECSALAKSSPATESAQIWCDHFQKMETELKKSKVDEFTLEKLKLELENTKALSATWGCKWAL